MRPAVGDHDEQCNGDGEHIASPKHQATRPDALVRFNDFPVRVRSHLFRPFRIAGDLRAESVVTGSGPRLPIQSALRIVTSQYWNIDTESGLWRLRSPDAIDTLHRRRQGAGPRAGLKATTC
jgi:hypothetical protein